MTPAWRLDCVASAARLPITETRAVFHGGMTPVHADCRACRDKGRDRDEA
jgi:hypothetical protein